MNETVELAKQTGLDEVTLGDLKEKEQKVFL